MSLLNDLLRLNQSQRGPMRMPTLASSARNESVTADPSAPPSGGIGAELEPLVPETVYQRFLSGMGTPGRSPMRRFFQNKFNDLFQEYQAKILDEQGRLPTTPRDPHALPPPGLSAIELAQWMTKWGEKAPPPLSFTNFLKGLNAENRFGSMAPGLRGQYSSQYAPRTRFLTF